ncbi:biopolymer transporter ExbD [Flavobacterium sp. LS1R47]|uniref:Biopolymer transporter ExbD n=1 Tax=Flavobacterium frigoritolerans TaxID=2987686 RepID=A0A9X2ZJB1_9FLAO|nr:biopolymer transporter ExbD [Flavobacterium frigoritolerans]MCV9931775.1 biopolymer transporter ExbD [Flavobacterium frigoritolerans]
MEIYKKDKKVRSKKLKTRVDLTAMVSVSFLLIGFFMITTELGKPKIMSLSLPEKYSTCGGYGGCSKDVEERVLTVLLDDNDRIVFYSGFLEWSMDTPKDLKYGKDGIRKELENRNKKVHEYSAALGKPGVGVTVIIKPSNKSNYKNLVDILDEIKIIGIKSYAIVNDFTPEESKLLAAR